MIKFLFDISLVI